MKTNTVTIEIDRLRVYAHHGVLPQERTVGNMFEVTLRIDYPAAGAVQADNLADTLNYAEAIGLVREIMRTPSELLEHVCGRIRDALLERWPAISGGSVRLTKVSPPVGAPVAGVSVTLPF